MGCCSSRMPKGGSEEFLVDQKPFASGSILGDIASTVNGSVLIRFPCGMTLARSAFEGVEPASVCPVKDANEQILFTVCRAGAEPKSSMFSPVKPLRKPTVVRNPAGAVIAMLQTDSTEPIKSSSGANSYTGYSARPHFPGQQSSVTIEGVPLYAWYTHWNGGNKDKTQIFLIGLVGLEKPHAYEHQLYGAAFMPPWKFTLATGEKAGVAWGTKVGGSVDAGGRNEVTVAKGMDAGLVAMAAFGPALLEAEFVENSN